MRKKPTIAEIDGARLHASRSERNDLMLIDVGESSEPNRQLELVGRTASGSETGGDNRPMHYRAP
jgi:hypothetical protein